MGDGVDREALAGVAGSLRRSLTWRITAANLVGAGVIYTYIQFISFSFAPARGFVASAVTIAVYGPAATAFGIANGRRVGRRSSGWAEERRAPTEDDIRALLAQPALQAVLSLVVWLGAAVLFPVVNIWVIHNSVGQSLYTGAITLLGGLTSSMLVFLLVEQATRPLRAAALIGVVPRSEGSLGVGLRLLLAWALGSGLVLVSLALAPLGPQRHGIGGQVVFLSLAGLIIGSALTLAAARLVVEPLAELRAAQERVQNGEIDVTLAVDDVGEIGMLQAGFNAMVSGLRERQRLSDLFGRHVGTDVARHALERGVQLGGELREVSALFVDMVGSTELAQRLSAPEVVELLNEFFGSVVRVVGAEGGWVNKFEGDAALCLWGAPADQPDHAERALRAARQLAVTMRDLAVQHRDLDVGIGVSTGSVVAGNVGAEERYEYTVVGDAVNEAARLTEQAKNIPARVAASERAVQRAGPVEAAWWEPGAPLLLRGRAKPTVPYHPRQATGGADAEALGERRQPATGKQSSEPRGR